MEGITIMYDNIDLLNLQKENAINNTLRHIYPMSIFCYVLFVLCLKWLLFIKIVFGIGILCFSIPSILSIFPAITLLKNQNEKIKYNAKLSIKVGILGLIELICYVFFVLCLNQVPDYRHKWLVLGLFVLIFIINLMIDSHNYAKKYKNNKQ